MNAKQRFTEAFVKNSELKISFEDLWKKIWFNLRNSNNSLRLTDTGLNFVKELEIRVYEIDLPKDLKISGQILIWLDRYVESPYHITDKKITVITERAALELHLFSGDLKKFGITKTLNKRLTQNLNS
jgi:hypothetical protein